MLKTVIYGVAILLLMQTSGYSQRGKAAVAEAGTMLVQYFSAQSIEGNQGGEDPRRRISVYLPPGYHQSNKRYPVVYFLHGYGVNDSLMVNWLDLKKLMDKAILSGHIRPIILVLPDSQNKYLGSFYTNSSLTGNWADFIAKDVVGYIDKSFRTLPHRNSRGLCGHSMGGNGTLKIAMQFPEVFSSIYALSPGALHWSGEFNITNKAFKKLPTIKNEHDIIRSIEEPSSADELAFWVPLMASLARAYSPDEKQLPYRGALPVTYQGDSMIINTHVLNLWESQFPIHMLESHLASLHQLKGIRIDWGRNDEFPHIPVTCLEFSKKLETYQVKHEAEEYIGRHENKLGGTAGRIYTDLLPFFNRLLEFETSYSK